MALVYPALLCSSVARALCQAAESQVVRYRFLWVGILPGDTYGLLVLECWRPRLEDFRLPRAGDALLRWQAELALGVPCFSTLWQKK